MQYEKINQNSLAQFMRTRVSVVWWSEDRGTLRTGRDDADLRAKFKTGKQYRRARKLVRRLLREELATANATA